MPSKMADPLSDENDWFCAQSAFFGLEIGTKKARTGSSASIWSPLFASETFQFESFAAEKRTDPLGTYNAM